MSEQSAGENERGRKIPGREISFAMIHLTHYGGISVFLCQQFVEIE